MKPRGRKKIQPGRKDMEQIDFLSAVLIVSQDPARLAAFYRDVVGIPLKDQAHGQSLPHYGCTLGDLHFAIHPVETFPDRRNGVGALKLALNVFDIKALVERLQDKASSCSIRPPTPDFSSAPRSTTPTATSSSSRKCATTGSSSWNNAASPASM
jgi:hypothetical protein